MPVSLLLVCLGGPADGHHEDVDHPPPTAIVRAAARYTQIPTDVALSMTVAGQWRTFRSARVKLYVYAGEP